MRNSNRNNIWLFAALAAMTSFAFTSCDDDDNKTPAGVISEIVTDDATALANVNGAFSHWQPLSSSFSFVIELNSNKLISFEGEEDAPGPLNSRFEQQADTWYQIKIFNHLLLGITENNNSIAEIEKAYAAKQLTEQGYRAAVGKAKFLRGLAYLYLVQLWGEVPVYTEAGGSTTERKPIDEVYAQIISDFTEAENLLNDYNGDPVTPSRQAAQALLARAYLIWGDNPLSASEVAAIASSQKDPAFTKTDSRLEKAVEYADKVISSGKLALDPDFAKLFGREYESNRRGTNEHIFTIHHDGDKSDAQGNHQTHCSWTFPFLNGENGRNFNENHTEVADDDLYDDWFAEYPTDKRLAKTYFTSLVNPEDNKEYTYYSPVYTPVNGKGVDQSYDNAENLEITFNSVDRIEIRYAEVLLIKAEALVQLGRNSEAAEPFNQLRKRAGIETVAAPTFEQIKREWDYEFTYEQKSLLNSLRWKDLIASVQQVKNYKHFDDSYATSGATGKDGNEVSSFFAKIHKHLVAKYNNVKGRHYRQPIPTGLTGEDLHLEQNPGY
ncbi:MAG: RagB/SusD family nutrient uptake outer membrane protein [Bacteroidales bacterium]|nr:RagB/SusD family nutrient uptake outer membrane protein [Bacteroidales bacterium]